MIDPKSMTNAELAAAYPAAIKAQHRALMARLKTFDGPERHRQAGSYIDALRVEADRRGYTLQLAFPDGSGCLVPKPTADR